MSRKPLSKEPARKLNDREVAKILGGLLGGLCDMASVEDVKNAVEWWASEDDAWEMFREMHKRQS
ncbi:MAG TPA: hypothetical protein VFA98_16245 [Thermoanaerobaculia bacterium]|nr:hypothetical protein [Thermoanaerobaculia bacterium]